MEIDLNDNDSPNQIIFDYNKKSNSYKDSYLIKDKNNDSEIYPFEKNLISNDDPEDLFNFININEFEENQNNTEHIYNYLYYNSLLSKFIIQHVIGKVPNKQLNIYLGFNSFPPSKKGNIENIITIINTLFMYASLFITNQLMGQKKKLDLFLYRLGISGVKNLINWIIIYFIQNSFILIFTYICFCFWFNYNHFFVIFYLIIYLITSFLMIYSIKSFSSSKNIGLMIYNIINIFPFVISHVLQVSPMIPILKILLCLPPTSNLKVTFEILSKYHTLQNVPFGIISLRINGTSYLINTIILILDSLFFSFNDIFKK